jgi:hypothetical protein
MTCAKCAAAWHYYCPTMRYTCVILMFAILNPTENRREEKDLISSTVDVFLKMDDDLRLTSIHFFFLKAESCKFQIVSIYRYYDFECKRVVVVRKSNLRGKVTFLFVVTRYILLLRWQSFYHTYQYKLEKSLRWEKKIQNWTFSRVYTPIWFNQKNWIKVNIMFHLLYCILICLSNKKIGE